MEVGPPVMTPESDWSCDTPTTSFRREIGTPLTFSTTKSSNKKDNISDLRTLTSSLLRKKRYSQMSAEKSTEVSKECHGIIILDLYHFQSARHNVN